MQIKNVKVYGLEESVIRSKFPMQIGEPVELVYSDDNQIYQGDAQPSDFDRAYKLANTPNGSGHNNFLKGIIVQFDLQYPEYFSPQLQRYHWIDIVSSQSKMHKITSRELTKDDFTEDTLEESVIRLNDLIFIYNKNEFPSKYKTDLNKRGFTIKDKTHCFNLIISNLPSGYLKWMGISANYLQLKTIYGQRKSHKLEEWQEFCQWIEALPMSNLITGKECK